MKKFLIMFTVCICILPLLNAQTNKYYNANESWIQTDVGMTMGQPNSITTKCFFVNGDSIIDSNIFKKVFMVSKSWAGSSFSGYSGSFTDPAYLVKEENDTVMVLFISSPDLITDTSWIFYDLDSSMIFYQYYFSDVNPGTFIDHHNINNIQDSIKINGVTRRIFNSFGTTYEGAFGISWGPAEPYTDPPQFDGFRHLQCYAGNDSVYLNYSGEIWPGDPWVLDPPVPGNCNIDSIYWSSIDEISNKAFYLYPNPAHQEIRIKIPDNMEVSVVSLYNNLGEKISITELDHLILNIDKLSSGLYTIEFLFEGRTIYRRFSKQ